MNKVLADTSGNIAYQLVGDVPIRRHNGANPFPVPGWSGEFDWTETIPFEKLPRSVNPDTHYVATANNRVVDATYPHWIGGGTPWRAWRIETLLGERDDFDVAGFQALQTDRYTMAAPLFQSALAGFTIDDDLQPYAALLREWDGVLSPESPGAALYERTGVALMRSLYAAFDDLPAAEAGGAPWSTWPSAKVLSQMNAGDTRILDLNPETRGQSWSDVFNDALRGGGGGQRACAKSRETMRAPGPGECCTASASCTTWAARPRTMQRSTSRRCPLAETAPRSSPPPSSRPTSARHRGCRFA